MKTNHFSGPLATEFADFVSTLEAGASANKITLTQLRALDRLTKESQLPSGTIDEALAKTWLAPCGSRGPNTRCARYYLLRRFCRFLAKRLPGTFVPGESLRPRGRPTRHPISTREKRSACCSTARSRFEIGRGGIPARSGRRRYTRSFCCWTTAAHSELARAAHEAAASTSPSARLASASLRASPRVALSPEPYRSR